jgi:hypothetical protein
MMIINENKNLEYQVMRYREQCAELDCQKNRNKFCYSCAKATERCFKNEIGCPCQKYKSYKEENAELKSECRTCVYTDSPCVRSDYPSKDGVCSHYKNVFDENTELKRKLEVLDGNTPRTEEKIGCEQSERISKPIQEINDVINRFEYERWRYD